MVGSLQGLNDLQLCTYSFENTAAAFDNSMSLWSLVPSRPPTPSSVFQADASWVLSDCLDSRESVYGTTLDLKHTNVIPSSTISMICHLKSSLLEEFEAACLMALSFKDPCADKTMRLLPWKAQRDLQPTSTKDTVIVKQVMFLLMNNFAGSDYAAFDALFEQVKHFSVMQMKDILQAIPAPYSTALQHSILTIAIKSNVPVIVKILLQEGLDIGRITCRFAGHSYTPLGLACKFRRLDIVKILVAFGVDVNQVDFRTQSTAMRHLLGPDFASSSFDSDFEPESCDILRILLNAGAKVGWQELENTSFWKHDTLLDVYLDHATTPTEFKYGYEIHRPLSNAMHLCDLERAAVAVKKMLGTHSFGATVLLPDIADRCMAALQHASYQGNRSLVDYFLSIGLQPDLRCLCQAIRGNHRGILQKYIETGANLDVVEGSDHHSRNIVRSYAGVIPPGAEPLLHESISIRYGRTTPFAEAIRWNRPDLVRMFGDLGVFATITESERFSAALLAAAEAGNTKMVKYLLKRTVEVPELITPALSPSISIATLGNYEDIVDLLMSAGIKPITSSITMAILVRNAKLVRLFLDVGVSLVDTMGLTYLAVRWGNLDVIAQLIQAGAPVNESGCDLGIVELNNPNIEPRSPLGEAIWRDNEEVMKMLLVNGARINRNVHPQEPSTLAVAIQRGGREHLVRELLARGADPSDPTAILAATLHSVDMTQLILDALFREYPSGHQYIASSALRRAIRDDRKEIVRMLAKHTNLNDREQRRDEVGKWSGVPETSGRLRAFLPTLLGEAIMTNDPHLVRILLDSGGDPNSTVETELPAPRRGRWPALSLAIHTDNLTIVSLLHEAGANLHYDATLRVTRTPLQLAVELGHYDIVVFLLDHEADVNSASCLWGGGTALQLAAFQGFVGIAELLLLRGADVNAPGSKFQGRTAFEGAAEHGRMDMLLLLYHSGLDLVSDDGLQVERAKQFAGKNGQVAAKSLVEKLAESAKVDEVTGAMG